MNPNKKKLSKLDKYALSEAICLIRSLEYDSKKNEKNSEKIVQQLEKILVR